jgi:hypothetical protein
MTEKELYSDFDIRISIFENDIYESEAFYVPALKTMFLSDKIAEEDRMKVVLHELGHKNHLPHLYPIFREKYEIQVNRNMIHYLIKEELYLYSDEEFNYISFMEKYKLKTIADETMVKEEYQKLLAEH